MQDFHEYQKKTSFKNINNPKQRIIHVSNTASNILEDTKNPPLNSQQKKNSLINLIKDIKLPKNLKCPKCSTKIGIEIDPVSLSYIYECINGHFFSHNEIEKLQNNVTNEKNIKKLKDNYKYEQKKYLNNEIDIEFYCEEHNEKYISYCQECKKDLCMLCLDNHEYHYILYYTNIVPKIRTVNNEMSLISENRKKINKLSKVFNEFIMNVQMELDNLIKDLKSQLNENESYLKQFNFHNLNYKIISIINNLPNTLNQKIIDIIDEKKYYDFNKKGKIILDIINILKNDLYYHKELDETLKRKSLNFNSSFKKRESIKLKTPIKKISRNISNNDNSQNRSMYESERNTYYIEGGTTTHRINLKKNSGEYKYNLIENENKINNCYFIKRSGSKREKDNGGNINIVNSNTYGRKSFRKSKKNELIDPYIDDQNDDTIKIIEDEKPKKNLALNYKSLSSHNNEYTGEKNSYLRTEKNNNKFVDLYKYKDNSPNDIINEYDDDYYIKQDNNNNSSDSDFGNNIINNLNVTGLCELKNKNVICIGDKKGNIILYDNISYYEIFTIKNYHKKKVIYLIELSDGTLLSCGADSKINIFKLEEDGDNYKNNIDEVILIQSITKKEGLNGCVYKCIELYNKSLKKIN